MISNTGYFEAHSERRAAATLPKRSHTHTKRHNITRKTLPKPHQHATVIRRRCVRMLPFVFAAETVIGWQTVSITPYLGESVFDCIIF